VVAGTHEGLALPLARTFIHGIDVIKFGCERPAQQGFASAGLKIPPAFADPGFAVRIGERDAQSAAGIIAQAEIGFGRSREEPARNYDACDQEETMLQQSDDDGSDGFEKGAENKVTI
jgi:hypothetical protein